MQCLKHSPGDLLFKSLRQPQSPDVAVEEGAGILTMKKNAQSDFEAHCAMRFCYFRSLTSWSSTEYKRDRPTTNVIQISQLTFEKGIKTHPSVALSKLV